MSSGGVWSALCRWWNLRFRHERLLIAAGVNEFGPGFAPLRGCHSDAAALQKAFGSRGWRTQLMGQFTKQALLNALENLQYRTETTPPSAARFVHVVLYLSTHGFLRKGSTDTYLAGEDSKPDNFETMISVREIWEHLVKGLRPWTERNAKCEVLLILDCCRRAMPETAGEGAKGAAPEVKTAAVREGDATAAVSAFAGCRDLICPDSPADVKECPVGFTVWSACTPDSPAWEIPMARISRREKDGLVRGLFTVALEQCVRRWWVRSLDGVRNHLSAGLKQMGERHGKPQKWQIVESTYSAMPDWSRFTLSMPRRMLWVSSLLGVLPAGALAVLALTPQGQTWLRRAGDRVLASSVARGTPDAPPPATPHETSVTPPEQTVASVTIAPGRRPPTAETNRNLFPEGSVTWKALGNAQKKEPRIGNQPVAWVRVPAGATTAGLMFDRLIHAAPPDWEHLQKKHLVIELACCVDSLTGGENKQLVRAELKNGYKKIREGIVLGVDEDLVVLRAMPTGSGLPESTVVDLSMANLLSNLGEDPGSRDPEVSLVVTLDGVAADVDLIIRAIYIR